MGKKQAFAHESLQDRESIAAYLEALVAGLRAGRLDFEQGDESMALEPDGLLDFSLRATRKRDRARLDLRIGWRLAVDEKAGEAPLQIRPGAEVSDEEQA